MRPHLNHLPRSQHENNISIPNRTQPMRHRNRRPVSALRRLTKRLLHQLLALSVQRTSRFIKKQNFRVSDQGTGDGDALALSAGKLSTTGAAGSGEAFWEGGDEVEDIGLATCFL